MVQELPKVIADGFATKGDAEAWCFANGYEVATAARVVEGTYTLP